MNFKDNKGVTLLALTVTIIVLLLISGTIITQIPNLLNTKKVNKLYNDIEVLNSKISDYYKDFGELPVFAIKYSTKAQLDNLIRSNGEKNNSPIKTEQSTTTPNDSDNYYVIDVEKLDGLTLNYGYGEDFNSVKQLVDSDDEDIISSSIDEIYIINELTHQIYYPHGIFANNIMYYTYNEENKPGYTFHLETISNTGSQASNSITFKNKTLNIIKELKIYGKSNSNIEHNNDNIHKSMGTINLLDLYNREPGTLTGSSNTTVRNLETNKYYIGLTSNNWYVPSKSKTHTLDGDTWHIQAVDNQSPYGIAFPIDVKPSTTYYISGGIPSNGKCALGFYDNEGNQISYNNNNNSPSFTTPANCYITTICLRANGDYEAQFKNIQVEVGTSATSYTPYGKVRNTNYNKWRRNRNNKL